MCVYVFVCVKDYVLKNEHILLLFAVSVHVRATENITHNSLSKTGLFVLQYVIKFLKYGKGRERYTIIII